MEKEKNVETYFEAEHHFKEGINRLRRIAKKTEGVETLKWGMPVYTLDNKNVFGIARFKHHFGLWFFNGAFMEDPKSVLENAQKGKTKAMRGWKFYKNDEINETEVLEYFNEALVKQKAGKVLKAKPVRKHLVIPDLLKNAFDSDGTLQKAFSSFTFYKQKEFCEYLNEAKQEKTKLRRLDKILPMIKEGVGLSDAYRK